MSLHRFDTYYNAEAAHRTARTFWNGLCIAADFKLHFNPDNAENIAEIHERVARRLHYICTRNGGVRKFLIGPCHAEY